MKHLIAVFVLAPLTLAVPVVAEQIHITEAEPLIAAVTAESKASLMGADLVRTRPNEEVVLNGSRFTLWRGALEGFPDSDLALTVGHGRVRGRAILGHEVFDIESYPNGAMVISARPPQVDGFACYLHGENHEALPELSHSDGAGFEMLEPPAFSQRPIVDILAVYDYGARDRIGSHRDVELEVVDAFSYLLRSLENSGLSPYATFRLLSVVGLEDFSSSEHPTGLFGALKASAGSLRDVYGADLVVGVVENTHGFGGLADPTTGYAVVQATSGGVSGRIFTHEVGHLLKLDHNPEGHPSEPPLWYDPMIGFGHSWCHTDGSGEGAGTIMNTTQPVSGCVWGGVENFSNPAVSVGGYPTGTEDRCNACVYTQTVLVSEYREGTRDPNEPSRVLTLGGRVDHLVRYLTPNGDTGFGKAEMLTPDTGCFWFFNPANVELVVKSLDACSFGDRFWEFAGGLTNVETELVVVDILTGRIASYRNPQGTSFQPVQDTDAFATCNIGGEGGEMTAETVSLLPDTGETLRLADRFEIKVSFATSQGNIGNGIAVPITSDTGYFWFFSDTNVEMVIKVLDACGPFDRFWVFAGGLTNVAVEITVTDTDTGVVKVYTNPQETAFQPIQDTDAFATCP